jgi:mRNA interferase HigB
MHIITRAALKRFSEKHPEAYRPLDRWFRRAKHAQWTSFAEIRKEYGKRVDQFGPLLIFDIGGNKFRLIVKPEYDWGKLYIRHVLTHAEYSQGTWKNL